MHQERPVFAIICMVVAMFLFSITNVLIKMLAVDYTIMQVIAARVVFAILPAYCFLMCQRQHHKQVIKSHYKHIIAMCLLGLASFWLNFSSFHILPFADATAFMFSRSIFVTILSAFILKEVVGLGRWSAIWIGFAGIIIMAQPEGNIVNIGAVYGVLGALFNSGMMIYLRNLSKNYSSAQISFYTCMISSIIVLPLLIPRWHDINNLYDIMLFVLLGICGGVAQIFLIVSYKNANIALVAPMLYSSIIWGVLFGYVLWGDIPSNKLMIGCSLLIIGGLIITYREAKFHRRKKIRLQ